MSRFEPLHLFFGYAEISAENGFAERFINLCTAEGIPLWEMKKSGKIIFAKTTLSGFKKIHKPAKESSMRVRLIKKRGLPFIADRTLKRTGLVIGMAAAAVFLSLLSGRIWIIVFLRRKLCRPMKTQA